MELNRNAMKRNAIYQAAALAKGDVLRPLLILCESQQSISTRRLELHLEDIGDYLKAVAIMMRQLSDEVPPNAQVQAGPAGVMAGIAPGTES
jgi:hypothetical protein